MNRVGSALSRFVDRSTARYVTHPQFWLGIAVMVVGGLGSIVYFGEQYAPESVILIGIGVYTGIFSMAFLSNAGDAADELIEEQH